MNEALQRSGAASQPHTEIIRQGLPESLPLRRDGEAASLGAGGYAIWLLVVLAGVAVLRALRSRGGAMPGWLRGRMGTHVSDLAVLSSRMLGPNTSVQVIRWNGKELLLGCTSQSISVLDSRLAAGVVGPVVAGGASIETPDAGGAR